jgi:hypothetical protein
MTPSTRKMRRDATGGKRGDGRRLQELGRRIRRPDARRIAMGTPDPSLTALAGLVGFGTFLRRIGVDRRLREEFGRLKDDRPGVVYPMGSQLRLLIDAYVAGEDRVFGLEGLAADPLFTHLAGGTVPSIDTVYRDLARFDAEAIVALEALVAEQGLAELRARQFEVVHLDIDTTVEPLFGAQEGAHPGPNPRYHGRPSYHPILASIAETRTLVGAMLRPGDTGFGGADAPTVRSWIERVRRAVGPECAIVVRIDAAADCTEIMRAIAEAGAFFVTKAKMTRDLCAAIAEVPRWKTVDRDADGEPSEQVAEVGFARGEWREHDFYPRVVAVRSTERENGKQIYLWEDLEFTVQAFITNIVGEPADELARRYNDRAGIEPLIGELKHDWGIGKVPSQLFLANHAAFLLKLLAYNLMRRYVAANFAVVLAWRAAWLRRALVAVPGRLIRSGRRRSIRLPPRSLLLAGPALDAFG